MNNHIDAIMMKKNPPTNLRPQDSATEQDAIIRFQNVYKDYHTNAGTFKALECVNLSIKPGEFTAVVGKSGSGKTTLINIMTGIDRPTSGEVVVAGTHLESLDENQLALWRGANLGIVFQFFQLLPTLTLLENVRLPMDFSSRYTHSERIERAYGLLKLVGVEEWAHQLPSQLSGGQQQSAAIARALANDPKILVTDEPTGNLDTKTSEQVFDLLTSLAKAGKTVMMVTHNDDLARRTERVITLQDGKII
jgi:putative ABC transport system ATP-binding protein